MDIVEISILFTCVAVLILLICGSLLISRDIQNHRKHGKFPIQ
jgi:hypothetical protein